MTDEQIIKALEICNNEQMRCKDGCPYFDKDCIEGLDKDCLALINRQKAEIDILIRKKETLRDEIAELQAKDEKRQSEYETVRASGIRWMKHCEQLQAEIERLREENTALDGANVLLTVTLHNARTEAIKEFAEKLKENEIDIDVSYGFGREHYTKAVATIVIDNLVKELTEGQR